MAGIENGAYASRRFMLMTIATAFADLSYQAFLSLKNSQEAHSFAGAMIPKIPIFLGVSLLSTVVSYNLGTISARIARQRLSNYTPLVEKRVASIAGTAFGFIASHFFFAQSSAAKMIAPILGSIFLGKDLYPFQFNRAQGKPFLNH